MLAFSIPAALSLCCLLLVDIGYVSAVSDHSAKLINSLPGFSGKFISPHYGGYINVNASRNRTLYYYFVTSEGSPQKDPVVLWINGGPGCSSFDGWVYEHGPFHLVPGAKAADLPTLVRNPYTWARVANVLYVDSPAGVGLSYTSDYNCDDYKTASDMHVFLLKWFTEWAEFQANAFYVAGESYAGIYVPNLMMELAKGITAKETPKINLKGYMIGNGCTDAVADGNAIVPFAYGHGLIDTNLFRKLQSACGGSYWNATGRCMELIMQMSNVLQDVNIYDILEPCFHGTNATSESKLENLAGAAEGADQKTSRLPKSFLELGRSNERKLRVRTRFVGRAWPLRSTGRDGPVTLWGQLRDDPYVPCVDDTVATAWLNDANVRKALHARPVSEIGKWVLCTERISYNANSGSMITNHRNLTMQGYRALIYSGDHDMCVPYTGSEDWTRKMGYAVLDGWRPWYVRGQVAGFTIGYANNLTFATIAGAGHTVPEYKPVPSLAFFTRWLANTVL